MWRKKTARLLILPLMGLLLSPGCATLTRRSKQRIPVTSTPAGAMVTVDGVQQGLTPIEIRLARKEKGQVIRIESPGYNPVEIRPARRLSGSTTLGNFLIGLIPGAVLGLLWGMANDESDSYGSGIVLVGTLSAAGVGGLLTLIDAGSDKGYAFKPKELTVTLTKADGAPRVDTIVIDAEDLKNVRWIRVRKD